MAPSPSALQAEGRATEAETARRRAALAKADPGVAQRGAAKAQVGAAVAEGVQTTALARRLATRTRVVRARRIPSALAEVRLLLPSFHCRPHWHSSVIGPGGATRAEKETGRASTGHGLGLRSFASFRPVRSFAARHGECGGNPSSRNQPLLPFHLPCFPIPTLDPLDSGDYYWSC